MEVPALMKTGQIAKACRWSLGKVRRELSNVGLLERPVDEKGRESREFRVSRSQLRERRPDMYDDVFEYFDALKPGERDDSPG